MATVEFAFMRPVGAAGLDAASARAVEIETSSASNVATAAAAEPGETCVVTASGGNVYVAFAATPNAGTAIDRRLVVDGQTRAFSGLSDGFKGACIDA